MSKLFSNRMTQLFKSSLIIVLFAMCTSSFAQGSQQWKEDLMREYNPQGYSYYKYGEGIVNQGKQIANGLTSNLNRYQNLIETTDPDELLADFESKMQNIEMLEQQYDQQSFDFGYQQGEQIGNAINSGDAAGALTGALGAFGAMSEMREAEKELERKKAALNEQRRQRMSEIYWNAIEYNDQAINNYIERAAYAEDPKDEQYNLNFVDNLRCYAKSMESNWSSTSTYWLNNNCPKPAQPNVNTIENKFVAKDVQYIKVARRKYDYYKESGHEAFLSAAISYAAAAAKTNPKASHFYQLGVYYSEQTTILALSTLLTAKQLDPYFFDSERNTKLEEVKNIAESEVSSALRSNDKEYITAFLDAGLDKTIKIGSNNILTQAITLDQPDAMQLVLNKYIDGLSQSEINSKLQKTIMLCAINNSPNCLERFIELGVPTDFELKGYTPIDVANKAQSGEAFNFLMDNSERKGYYENKYADSPTLFFAKAKTDISAAISQLNTMSTSSAQAIVSGLLDEANSEPDYMEILSTSVVAKDIIRSTPKFSKKALQNFAGEVKKASPGSNAAKYLSSDLVSFDQIPSLAEIKPQEVKATPQEPKKMVETGQKGYSLNSRLNMMFSQMETGLQSFRDMETNQYFSEEQKRTSIKKSEEYVRKYRAYLSGTPMPKDEENELDGSVYIALANDTEGAYSDYKEGFIKHIRENYTVVNEVSFKDKTQTTIDRLEVVQNEMGTDMSGAINMYKGYLNKSKPASYEKDAVNNYYGMYALSQGRPIDEYSISRLDQPGYVSSGTTTTVQAETTVSLSDDENIAYHAFNSKNYELFEALDRKFDLSKVRTAEGKSLFLAMITSGGMFSNEKYISNDFDFNMMIDGISVKQYYLEERGTRLYGEELKNFINLMNLTPDAKVTVNGGTMLHWAIQRVIDAEGQRTPEIDYLSRLSEYNFDPYAEDNDGKTAWDLFSKNEKVIEDEVKDARKKEILAATDASKIILNMIAKDTWEEKWNAIHKALH
ncbi:MAG: hypothetical protein ABJG41_05110 [Cyclobacteriaceae bacterium]